MPSVAEAQAPSGPILAPPALPPTLPGGMPVPSLPAGTQQEILQRILDAAGGRAIPQIPSAPPQPLGTAGPAQGAPWAGSAATPLPTAPAAPADDPPSHTEAFFAERLGLPLRQFGYDSFRAGPSAAPVLGALPDDYLIGRDDELILAMRGRTRATLTLRVLRDGTILAPDLPPVPAAGRTLRELRADLESRMARDMPGTELFVSIGQVRQIAIFVGGEVQRPGMQALTALSTVLDALQQAGGVRKTGSLRAIRIDGPHGSRVLDLYTVIAGEGGPAEIRLREGERILVPALGGVVAVAGEVTRPAIYELPPGTAAVPLSTVLRLAGEPLRPSGNRFLVQGTDASGRRSFTELRPTDHIRRGDSVLVQPGADVVANQLRLSGHVAAPLTRAVTRGATLRGLLSDPRLLRPDPYVRLGVVLRLDPATRVRSFVPFDLARVMGGSANLALTEGDEVLVLGNADIAFLASPPVQRALRGEAPADNACPALTMLAIAARSAPARFAHARGAGFPDIGAPGCPAIFQDHPPLLAFLLDTAVLLTGEVKQPGLYPVQDDTGLDLLLAAAGGVTDGADLSAVELAREPTEQGEAIPLTRLLIDLRSRNFRAVRLSPRDVVRIPRGFTDRETGPVTLVGEVLRPGAYDIRRGERLSELLQRAGGLTPQAYAYGTVFTREAVRLRQQDGFARAARDIETSLLSVAAGQANAGGLGQRPDLGGLVAAGRELANTLRQAQAAGRMVVEANPVILAARPDLDVLLEPGDLIVIPKRPTEVTVVGSVLNPGSLQFQSGWRATDYVRAAGGTQRFADTSRAFVVLPNGQSAPAGLSGWQAGGPPVPPGSLVVVPQDPSPFETRGLIRDLTAILGQVTISAAALAVISRELR
ncbi:SLBB domain-containing protein [Falsiroseomonas sp.]|uniref:SLBB domain-containing protein n=1 Tax=Falsiroseomonas sp. TaxID=2870721 RepID=UPI0034A41A56